MCTKEIQQFCSVLNRFRQLFQALRKQRKFSISDPKSFEELWSVNSNGVRVLSLVVLLVLLVSIPLALLFRSNSSYFGPNDKSIERTQLEEQSEKISELVAQISTQENYIANIRKILSGDIPIDTPLDSLKGTTNGIDPDSLHVGVTTAEKKLASKLRNDMSTDGKQNEKLVLFGSPVTGVISQKYNKQKHPGIDVVTEADRAVTACLGGTVIYAGFTRMDGHIIIIDHGNGFLSVYKHNKRALKSVGARVRIGDPIAIVGNTGENSTGPHLHFELWLDQSPVNPLDYISFKK
ncbi:MAG: hypothetical protein A3D92_03730 [Bacteroidetes bacterium RIFCSPHIGHO2_02_FULL_44_7]|nr:MAG: hypothetical protein A3D92_03730 [Bacteroidetes bacterium RIFCSPHIGHO2_02_FULL_44_7]